MTGRTHIAVGAAGALLAAAYLGGGEAGPLAGPLGANLLLAGACGAAGAVLPDLDVHDARHPVLDRVGRGLAVALLAAAVLLDALNGAELLREALAKGTDALLGVLGFVALFLLIRASGHRSFSHSLPALAGVVLCLGLVSVPAAAFVGIGYASHLALDLLNKRPVRLFWPLKGGVYLGLCTAGGVVDACLLAAGVLAVLLTVAQRLGLPGAPVVPGL